MRRDDGAALLAVIAGLGAAASFVGVGHAEAVGTTVTVPATAVLGAIGVILGLVALVAAQGAAP